MRRRTALAASGAVSVTLVAGLLGGCGPDGAPQTEVTVTGEYGAVPELEYDKPLEVSEAWSELLWEGQGPVLREDEPVLVDFYAEDGRDGSLVNETYTSDPKPHMLSPESVSVEIFEALVGRPVGSRVLHVVPEGPTYPRTVAVYDILPTRADGEPVEVREGLPEVELADDGAPSVTIPEDVDPPQELVVQPLLRGTGEQVSPGQVVTVQYTGVTWSDGEVFDTTWGNGKLPAPFPIAVGLVVPAWDEGLVEQTVGSQVLLVAPPQWGYGGTETELADETLVFVVDILAVRGEPRDRVEPTE
ncbi:FKBP-type peptidyl-prolyl cis-trans isomerase [Cellulomonas bogoriensis]|uniref:Peptidyl-prolyl cis-trans isomerase n=1 Tax=Cellulomonas bogoriensis 69B4 = DSM 16987 TaxID=1386082 RepID=A0A0A0C2G0_9CELL|nr:peptidylprolyl isomerase [Cellulomonas bogoriensis 69B4 = DSM 16987]